MAVKIGLFFYCVNLKVDLIYFVQVVVGLL